MWLTNKDFKEKLECHIDNQADDLFSDYFNWRMLRSPEFSTLIGLKEYNDKLENFTEERFSEDLESCRGISN